MVDNLFVCVILSTDELIVRNVKSIRGKMKKEINFEHVKAVIQSLAYLIEEQQTDMHCRHISKIVKAHIDLNNLLEESPYETMEDLLAAMGDAKCIQDYNFIKWS